MSSIKNKVTCSLFKIKADEINRNEHLVSMNQLQLCKDNTDKTAIKFLEMIFNACPRKSRIYNLKSEKTHDCWQLHFSTNLPKEKFSTLCSDWIDNSELINSVSLDFKDFISKVTPIIGKN